ncbi:MAG: DUF1616 domain-containing protein [Candidatus Diapherotrites archaeon]
MLDLVLGLVKFVIAVTVPGYFLTLGFFPSKKEIDGIERLTYSLVFSITVQPLLLLLENQLFQIPVNEVSVFATFFLVIALGAIAYFARAKKLQKEEVFPLLPLGLK